MAWTEPTPLAPGLSNAAAQPPAGTRHPGATVRPDEAAPQEAPSDAGVLFGGDRGVLPLDTRQVLVQLLLGPFVDGTRHTGRWAVLVRDEAMLRSRLHELFLELVVAHDEKVAFVRQVSEDGLEAPILLRRLSLTFLETALLLYLRQCLTQAQAQGERAVVSRDELLEHLSVYERERNADRVKFDQQATRAIQKLRNLNLLRLLRGSGQRFEVAPTLRLLFPAEEILALVRVYKSLAVADPEHAGEPAQPADGSDGDGEMTPEAQLRREVLASRGANPAAGLEAVLARERRRADALDAQRRERPRTGPGVAGANAARPAREGDPAQEGGFGGLDQGEVYEGAAEDADDEALEDELDEDFDEGLDEGFDEDDRPAPGSEERP